MASTIAALNIMVNANTGSAIGQLSLLDKKLKESLGVANATSTGMTTKLGPKMMAGAGLAAVGVAAVVAGKQLFDLGKDLDGAYDKIRVGTGATGKRLDKLKADFRSVASSVPDDFDTVGKSIAGLNTRLDLSGKPLRRMSRNMLNLSRITETDLEGNIKSVSRAFQDWDVPVKKQTRSLNGLFRLSQKGGGDVSELAENIQKFGSPLRNLGFDISEAAAMFATFEKAGVNTQTMVPGLKLALANLTAPTDKLKGSLDSLDVAIGNPKKGLQQVMDLLGDKSKLKATDKINLAMQVFGKRAGADMAEAVKQGRFNVDNMVKTFKHGSDTIGKTTRDTNDFGENMAIFGNKIKIAFAPLADVVFNAVGKLSAALAGLKINQYIHDVRNFMKTNEDFKDVLRAVGVSLSAMGAVAKWVFNNLLKPSIKSAGQIFLGLLKIVRGAVKIISGLLTGNFGKAWSGVKDIFAGGIKYIKGIFGVAYAPIKVGIRLITRAMTSIFKSAWDKVEGIFEGGANAVIDVVNAIIRAINAIPGVPDIDEIGSVGGGGGPKTPAQKAFKTFQRGSYITGGKPTGDSVPALLERGEYVLNRNAVKKVGVERLNNLNFKAASRFQSGGPIGMIGGGIMDAAKGAAGAAAGAVSSLAMKGPNFFIGKLPKPNIPEPFTGVGPYVIKKAIEYIKDKANPFSGGGSLKGGGDIVAVGRMLQGMGYEIGEHPAFGPVGNHSANSAHYSGRAIDVNDDVAPRGGSEMASLDWLAPRLQKLPHSQIIWRNQDIDTGAAIPDHMDHLHFAMQRGGFLGRHIRRLMVGGAAEHGVVKRVGADLLSHGFDFKSTAGILGNAWREGLWNPSQMEMTGADNGGLWGFTAYEKSLANLRAYAESKGKRWDDPIVQTHFMMKTGGNSIKGALNALDSIPETTKTFMDEYEIPASATAALDIRTSAAFDAAKILRDAGITKPGDEAGGDTGPSAAERKKSAREDRKTKRTGIIDKLLGSLRGKVGGERLGDLWKIIGAYAKFGKFEGSEKSMLLGQAGAAARAKSPVVAANGLDRLRLMLGDLVEVSGEPGTNESLVERLKKIKAKGTEAAAAKRDRIFSKVKKAGMNYPFMEEITGADGIIASLAEQLDIAERMASFEGGPGGSELTEAEKVEQVRLNESILGNQGKKNQWLIKAIAALYGRETVIGDQIWAATPKNSTSHWKLGSLKTAAKQIRSNIGTLTEGRITLTGLTGRGGEMFDTQMRLKELGVTSTVESASAAARDSELASLMREQLSLANRNNAILSAQMPIYTQFMPKYHTGGVIPGAGEQPIMAMGGEGVFTRDQMAAMGGSAPVITLVIEEGAGIDASKIRAEVNGELTRLVTKQRTGNYGPKYTTAGRA